MIKKQATQALITFTAAGFSLVKTEGSTSYEMTFKLTPGRDNVEVTTKTTRPTTGRSLNTTNENMTTARATNLVDLYLEQYKFHFKDNA